MQGVDSIKLAGFGLAVNLQNQPDPALDLIDSMLVGDPEKRFVLQQCLDHPWMLAPEGQND